MTQPRNVSIKFAPRGYQKDLIDFFRGGGKHAMEVWHRRAGKDRAATFIESMLAFQRKGLYWHALPEYRHARRVIWDNITKDGEKLLDTCFPEEVIARRSDQEMKLELKNGSIWQVVGADNFDALVGSNPVHVTLSEFAIMNSASREFIRPILAENGGSELVITTPRGYNHAFDLHEYAKHSDLWHHSLLTVDDTNIISQEILDEERKTMPDELFRQEYYCDFSAANVGSILGRQLEKAEKEGRINPQVTFDPEFPIEISSDIGFRDTASWWFWQPIKGGFNVINYDADSGLDAPEWVDRLQGLCEKKGYKIGTIHLPHDAKAKTFNSKRSAEETFRRAFDHVHVPQKATRKSDQINAARMILNVCNFNVDDCALGLKGLRAWAFKYNYDTKQFSKDPDHNWASHPGDAFAEGAVRLTERTEIKVQKERSRDAYGFDDEDYSWKIA